MAWVEDIRERAKHNTPLLIVLVTGFINVALSIILAVLLFSSTPGLALALPIVTTAVSVWVVYISDCVEVGKCRPAAWIIAIMSIFLALTKTSSALNSVRILSR